MFVWLARGGELDARHLGGISSLALFWPRAADGWAGGCWCILPVAHGGGVGCTSCDRLLGVAPVLLVQLPPRHLVGGISSLALFGPRASGGWVGGRCVCTLRSPCVAPRRTCRRSALLVRDGALLAGGGVGACSRPRVPFLRRQLSPPCRGPPSRGEGTPHGAGDRGLRRGEGLGRVRA